ncbi:MAG: Ig-like domain repeat protein, partial [Candidatus Poribacteria bacterium]
FMIDTQPPSKIQQLYSESHISDSWSSINKATIRWDEVKDDLSGILGYQWGISKDHKPIFDSVTGIPLIVQLDEGIQYVFIRAVDNAGNYGIHREIIFKVDTNPPEMPIIFSPSHPEEVWYSDSLVQFEWSSSDKTSGIKEFKWSWSMDKNSIPTEEILASLNSIELVALEPGIWYFHLFAIDNAGNQSKVAYYKVQIDPNAPPAPKIFSDMEITKEWSNRRDIRFLINSDVPSGIIGYSYVLDHNPLSTPSETVIDKTGKIEFQNLDDGIWYFHCKAKSGSGIWGQTSHFEFKIDTTPPEISITYPENNKWYNKPISQYSGIVDDALSGIDWDRLYYRYNDTQSSFHIDTIQGNKWTDKDEIPHLNEGNAAIQVIVYDKAGNYAVTTPYIFMVDSSISSPLVMSITHPNQDKWYNNDDLVISWGVQETLSGVDGFSWILDNSERTSPKEFKMTLENSIEIKDLQDGIHYFHIRAVDKAGNWSETSHYKIMIDKTPPIATISLTGIAVANGDITIVRQGTVEISLKTSEPVYNPSLKYKSASSIMAVPIELKGFEIEWKGAFDVTLNTGDGNARFIFSAYDKAGNLCDTISKGEFFIIDTLIRSDSNEIREIICLSEPKTKIKISPESLNNDIRIEIIKIKADIGTVATYEIMAYDLNKKHIKDIRFRKPIEINFDNKYESLNLSVYFWDGVKWNRIQD